ncbi:parallel beta-helix domain-containing protein [Nitratireductor sp. XY-223]|uniref:parallel beta-helix domain-containing protein n=1 Tax=Nitratireductor sp. XY-223 TaxID=2561926 RepID=UPI00197EA70C|nr:parallel beta-helix domain-containing protein [Nitratireductor sp. XY-223]
MGSKYRVFYTLPLLFALNTAGFAAGSISIVPGPDAAEELQEALITAEPGSMISLAEGTFEFSDGLSLDVPGVTIRGAGMDKTVLSFGDQKAGGEGFLITSDNVTLEDFAVVNTRGDGIKSKGADQISYRRIRVEWTGGPDEKNGAYGIYPVESKNVLVEDSLVRGASDAGIYVGQSENIVVRNSTAAYNVAGIEIENSKHADVYGNTVTHNTGGILVFDLPNLPVMGGHSVRVFENQVIDNDTPNFAPAGNIVGMVAKGTGIMVMANRNVHVFDNVLKNNGTVHVLIATYPNDFDDDTYVPHPRAVLVRDNSYGDGGGEPDGEVGKIISDVTGTPVPDIVWDGVVPLTEWITWTSGDDRIYVNEADGTTFANLRMIQNTLYPWSTSPDRDISDYEGTLPEPDMVSLPQLQVQ